MASNHTTNFELCQWQADDQVKRTDFNEDNAKIDAALGGLAARTGMVTIREFTVETSYSNTEISLEEIDWSEWKTIHVDIIPAAGTSANMYVCYGLSFFDRIGPLSTTWNHVVLLPFGQPEMRVTALFWGDSGSFFRAPNMKFSGLYALAVIAEYGTEQLIAGSKIIIRGERM